MQLMNFDITKETAVVAAIPRARVLLFSGDIPETLEDFEFDTNSLNEVLLNCAAYCDVLLDSKTNFNQGYCTFKKDSVYGNIPEFHNFRPKTDPIDTDNTQKVLTAKTVRKCKRDSEAKDSGMYASLKLLNISTLFRNEYYMTQGEDIDTINGLEFDLGQVRSVDGLYLVNYYRTGESQLGFYRARLEHFDEDLGEWVASLPMLSGDNNIPAVVSEGDISAVKGGIAFAANWSSLRLTFNSGPIVARKFRIFADSASTLGGLNFLTDLPVEQEVEEYEELTYALILPYVESDSLEASGFVWSRVKISNGDINSDEFLLRLDKNYLGLIKGENPSLVFDYTSTSAISLTSLNDGRLSNGVVEDSSSDQTIYMGRSHVIGFTLDKSATISCSTIGTGILRFYNSLGAIVNYTVSELSATFSLEAGQYQIYGNYTPTISEFKAENYDSNVPFVFSVEDPNCLSLKILNGE